MTRPYPVTAAPRQFASLSPDVASFDERSQLTVPADTLEVSSSTGTTGETTAVKTLTPQVAIEDVCVAMATSAVVSELPVGFFARLIWQESKFGQWVVSKAGAQGVAQFMPKTAAWIGLPDPFDPIAALPASARFLRMLLDQFGNLGLAAAAYNGGPTRLQNWLAGKGPLPEETRNYVRVITGHEVEKWLEPRELQVSFNLPPKAPCEGLAGLSYAVLPERHTVEVEPGIVRLIQTARVEAAKRAARVALLAKKLARKKGSVTKLAAGAGRKMLAKKLNRNVKLARN